MLHQLRPTEHVGAPYVRRLENGEPIWKINVRDLGGISANFGFTSSPLVYQDKVIVKGGGDVMVVALNNSNVDLHPLLPAMDLGNGVIDAGEECDDANLDDLDGCSNSCVLAACGDGTLNIAANEICDGGGQTAACDDDCTVAVCGDSKINAAANAVSRAASYSPVS